MPVNVNPIMAAIVEAADTLNTAPDDYINPDDGLKYCGKCHTPKEAYFPEQYRKNGLDKHPIACKCAAEERARREAEQRELERLNRISMLRSEAFRDIPAAGSKIGDLRESHLILSIGESIQIKSASRSYRDAPRLDLKDAGLIIAGDLDEAYVAAAFIIFIFIQIKCTGIHRIK